MGSSRAGSLAGLKALVVDDDAEARGALVAVLEYLGARVTPASSAADARIVLRFLRPDIILSDISMPEEDGCRFMTALRGAEAERGGHIAAIAVTGRQSAEERARALAAGFERVVGKPYGIDDIADAVRERLAQQPNPVPEGSG